MWCATLPTAAQATPFCVCCAPGRSWLMVWHLVTRTEANGALVWVIDVILLCYSCCLLCSTVEMCWEKCLARRKLTKEMWELFGNVSKCLTVQEIFWGAGRKALFLLLFRGWFLWCFGDGGRCQSFWEDFFGLNILCCFRCIYQAADFVEICCWTLRCSYGFESWHFRAFDIFTNLFFFFKFNNQILSNFFFHIYYLTLNSRSVKT